MRQETNNEIDLLLRRLSRRQEVPVSDAIRASIRIISMRMSSAHMLRMHCPRQRAHVTQNTWLTARSVERSSCSSAHLFPLWCAKETVTASAPSGLQKVSREFLFADGFTLRGAGARIDRCCCDRFCSFAFKPISCEQWPNWSGRRKVLLRTPVHNRRHQRFL